ncbi:MAG TPA: cupredoxin domain-containing protein, partial [Gemmatimonadales bacterium]|nr:cupredoxin domain-containing protein [Gemmatimonadales bacterium]
MTRKYRLMTRTFGGLIFAASALGAARQHQALNEPVPVTAKLSEWKVELSEATVAPGPVTFTVTNAGSIPHGFEVEGRGIEKQIALIQPGSSARLTLTLQPGTYEVYCPVGQDSHKKLGMETHLTVGAKSSGSSGYADIKMKESPAGQAKVQVISVTGGGPVIQILPGPFPFADSAAPILKSFGDEKEGLESQAQSGPYSNNVAPIAGSF